MSGHDHDHHHHHHDHDHSELSETELRVRALESILTEKGYVDPTSLDLLIELYEKKIGPRNGIRVVGKSLGRSGLPRAAAEDATSAIAELDYSGRQGEHMVVVENTPEQHNMVVCTLCSCYPHPGAGPAAGLVQIRALPLPRRRRSARCAPRFWRDTAGRHKNPRLGLHRRNPLPRAADAP
jgi:nitrile hydratase